MKTEWITEYESETGEKTSSVSVVRCQFKEQYRLGWKVEAREGQNAGFCGYQNESAHTQGVLLNAQLTNIRLGVGEYYRIGSANET